MKPRSSKLAWSGLALLTALALALVTVAQTPAPDLILTNGKIVTADEQFRIAQAVAIRGDHIVATGTAREIGALAGAGTRTIDLAGRTAIPGLIDNHIHLLRAAGTWLNEVRLDGVFSRGQAVELLRKRAADTGPGGWVYTIGGWTHHQFADNPQPFSREELDRILPANPAALQESYYQVFLNSRALEEFGIRQGAPDPPEFVAGSIQRDGSGRPTGIIQGDIAATRPVAARLPRVPAAQIETSAAALIQDMNRAGLTSFGVVGCAADMLEIVEKWKREGRLNARIFCIDGPAAGTPEAATRSIEQIGKMKLFQGDSAIDSVYFGESVYSPLHDPMFATSSNPPAGQLAEWKRMAMAIAERGLPLHVHAELGTTIGAFLDQIEAINREHPVRNLRWALAHVNQIDADDLERMKRLGMYAAVHPWAVINAGIMRADFGESAMDMPPLATIQNSGISWGFGSDGTAANQYMPFVTLSFAVTGRMAGGAAAIRQTIGREDALLAYTRKNAYLVFQENNLGSIQAGKLADLVVLDRDYLTAPVNEIQNIRPVMTMVGGRIVYDAR